MTEFPTLDEVLDELAPYIEVREPRQPDEFTAAEFAARYGFPPRTARDRLSMLVNEGILTRRKCSDAGSRYVYRLVKDDAISQQQ